MGDGIMALFGAPLADEDHAVRACYAVLRMQDSVRRYAEEVERTASTPIQSASGSTRARSSCAPLEATSEMDYTAVGHTTHLAARIEQETAPGSILVSPHTLRLAEGFVPGQASWPDANQVSRLPI